MTSSDIGPAECIDCDAFVEACPVDAITPEDQIPRERAHLIEIKRRLVPGERGLGTG